MKNLSSILLMFLIGTLVFTTQQSELFITYDGYKTTFRQNLKVEEVPSLRDRMSSLIKDGNVPIILEEENDVVWIFLNDSENARDYPDTELTSDYSEIIQDLFPLKLTKKLKKSLKKGNKAFIKTLGIEYLVENEEVISKINYKTFEKFVF